MKFFSKRLDKMFEGYEEQTYFDANGKRVTKMIYTGRRFVAQLSDTRRIVYKILFGILYILGLGLTVVSGIPTVPANLTNYVTMAQALCMILGVITGVYVFMYLSAIIGVEEKNYRRIHIRLPLFSAIAAGVTLITAILSVISTVNAQVTDQTLPWLCIAMLVVSAACYAAIAILELKTEYIIADSDAF